MWCAHLICGTDAIGTKEVLCPKTINWSLNGNGYPLPVEFLYPDRISLKVPEEDWKARIQRLQQAWVEPSCESGSKFTALDD